MNKVKFAEKSQLESYEENDLDEDEFEEKVRQHIYKEAWEDLEQEAVEQLDQT